MLRTVTGPLYAGSLLLSANKDVKAILGTLGKLNDPETQMKIKGLQNLTPFVKKMEGFNGMVEQFKSLRIFATEDSTYVDAPSYNEAFSQWFYTRQGWKLKDLELSLALLEDAYEKDLPLKNIITERLQAVSVWYLEEYLPNTLYQTILKIPTAAQSADYYAAPVGFLKDTVVDKFMLKPGVTRTKRNNYKCIKDAGAGVTIADLEHFVEYFTEFADTDDGNIVIYAGRSTISKTRNTLADPGNQDIFARTGKPATTIEGIQFVEDDRIPRGMMLMLDGAARDVIAHVVSPKKDLQGIAAVKDDGYKTLDTVTEFVGLTNMAQLAA